MNRNVTWIVAAEVALVALLFITQSSAEELGNELRVGSPDGSIDVAFDLLEGKPTYSISRRGEVLIRPSRMGFRLVDAPPLDSDFVVASSRKNSVSNKWEQTWGEKRNILCEFNELRVELRQRDTAQRRLVIVFRVFDDGVGFRYEWPQQPNLQYFEIADEITEFAFAGDPMVWWIPAYQREHYEYLYRRTPVSEIPQAHTPATFEMPSGAHLSIHEAALVDFASMTLSGTRSSTLKADLTPWSDGIKVKANSPHRSPWRTIQIADNAAGLITSNVILNLNEPCKFQDISWIKPGKYVGIWWEMHLDKSTWSNGPRHGATTENARRYVDFAAANRFDGVLVEGWNKGWDGDWIKHGGDFSFTEPNPDYEFEKLAKYARQKGVRLIAHNETGGVADNYERQLESAFSLYQRLGIRAVKTGYVNFANGLPRIDKQGNVCGEWHYGQYMVRHHQKVIETAAKHQLMLDVHEPVKPTGLHRTYPNLMTAEGARGQEYNAWSPDGGNPPEHETILPFTRLLAGPMDFTPGIFDLTYPEYRPDNRVNTTLAKQLALYVVLYSPLQMAADLPQNYAALDDAFQFIRDVPTDWEETRVLDARIGDCVTIVRRERGGDHWFLGSITDEQARTLETPLSFLDRGTSYIAEIYRDADKANWQANPTAYTIESREVDARTVLQLRLAPGGGQAIRFRAIKSANPRKTASLKPQLLDSSGTQNNCF
jgi:alpha-glucosidase